MSQDGIQEIYLPTGALCIFPDEQLNAIVEYVGPLQQAVFNLDTDIGAAKVMGTIQADWGLVGDIQEVGTANAAGTSKKHTDASHVHQGVHSVKGFVDATEKYGDLILKIDATTAAATVALAVADNTFTLSGVRLDDVGTTGAVLANRGSGARGARNDHVHGITGVAGTRSWFQFNRNSTSVGFTAGLTYGLFVTYYGGTGNDVDPPYVPEFPAGTIRAVRACIYNVNGAADPITAGTVKIYTQEISSADTRDGFGPTWVGAVEQLELDADNASGYAGGLTTAITANYGLGVKAVFSADYTKANTRSWLVVYVCVEEA